MLQEVGRIIIVIGIILIVVGAFFWLFGKLPFIGKLPGDILIKREKYSIYFPITTAILISLFLSIVFTIISSLKK